MNTSDPRRPISIVRATCAVYTRVRDDCRRAAVGGREAAESKNPIDNDRLSRYGDGRYPRTIVMCNVRCARALVCVDAGRGSVYNGRATVILVIVSSSDTPFPPPFTAERRLVASSRRTGRRALGEWELPLTAVSRARSAGACQSAAAADGQTSDRLTHVARYDVSVRACARLRVWLHLSFSNRWDNVIIYVYCKYVNSGRIAIEPAEREAIKRTDDIIAAAAARYVPFFNVAAAQW